MDPISILAATSFGLEALGFLLKAGFELYHKSEQARKCADGLYEYHRRLRECRLRIHEWNQTWGGFKSETYEYFWGCEVFRDTKELLVATKTSLLKIQSQITGKEYREGRAPAKQHLSVRKLLRSISGSKREEGAKPAGKEDLAQSANQASQEEWNSWTLLTEEERKASGASGVEAFADRTALPRHANLCFKIGFALYLSTALQEDLDNLERQVTWLEKQTMDAFRRMRGHSLQEVEPDERWDHLNRVSDIKATRDAFAAFSEQLHSSYTALEQTVPWALELRVPQQQDDSHSVIELEETCNIDIDLLLCLDGDDQQGVWRRVRVQYRPAKKALEAAREIPRRIIGPTVANVSSTSVKVKILERMERRSLPFRLLLHSGRFADIETHKAWENDRAVLMFGLTNWIVLMWNSSWSAVPCTCGIRFEELKDSRQYTFAAEKHEGCRNAQYASHKLLLLAIVIAELLLGTSLRVDASEWQGLATDSRIFDLEKWSPDEIPPQWTAYSRYHMLGDVRALPGGVGLAQAISFCLDRPHLGLNTSLSEDKRRAVVKNVAKPVYAYYELVTKHRAEFDDTEWAKQSLLNKWPREWLFE